MYHEVVDFEKIMMKKNERDFLKQKYNLVEEKFMFNNSLVTSIVKRMKNKEDAEKIINLEKENTEQNKFKMPLKKLPKLFNKSMQHFFFSLQQSTETDLR